MSKPVGEFVPLKGFEDFYEIYTLRPYYIRNKKTKREIKEFIRVLGADVQIKLKGKTYNKRLLIKEQFDIDEDNIHCLLK